MGKTYRYNDTYLPRKHITHLHILPHWDCFKQNPPQECAPLIELPTYPPLPPQVAGNAQGFPTKK